MPGNVLTSDGNDPSEVMNIGSVYARVFLQPFVLELALKGLIQRLGTGFLGTHDLVLLLEDLPDDVVSDLESRFAADTGGSLRQFVVDHRKDFEGMRYLETSYLETSRHSRAEDWHFAICAVLDRWDTEGPRQP